MPDQFPDKDLARLIQSLGRTRRASLARVLARSAEEFLHVPSERPELLLEGLLRFFERPKLPRQQAFPGAGTRSTAAARAGRRTLAPPAAPALLAQAAEDFHRCLMEAARPPLALVRQAVGIESDVAHQGRVGNAGELADAGERQQARGAPAPRTRGAAPAGGGATRAGTAPALRPGGAPPAAGGRRRAARRRASRRASRTAPGGGTAGSPASAAGAGGSRCCRGTRRAARPAHPAAGTASATLRAGRLCRARGRGARARILARPAASAGVFTSQLAEN